MLWHTAPTMRVHIGHAQWRVDGSGWEWFELGQVGADMSAVKCMVITSQVIDPKAVMLSSARSWLLLYK